MYKAAVGIPAALSTTCKRCAGYAIPTPKRSVIYVLPCTCSCCIGLRVPIPKFLYVLKYVPVTVVGTNEGSIWLDGPLVNTKPDGIIFEAIR